MCIIYNFYLVASSKIKIDGFFNKALAIAIRCFWPPESCVPFSPTCVLYLFGNFIINS